MNRNKVLIVTSALYIGGLETIVSYLCKFIDYKKFDAKICCLEDIGNVGDMLIADGYDVFSFKKPFFLKNNYFSWLQLLVYIIKNNVDVLHTHTLSSLLDAVICKVICRRVRIVHTFHFGNYPHRDTDWLHNDKFLSRFADVLVAVGNEQKKKIISTLEIDEKKIVTVWNGIPELKEKKLQPNLHEFFDSDKVIIGTVCTLIEQKGLVYLLEVASRLMQRGMDVVFLIAGEGSLRAELEIKIEQLGLNDNVILAGWVDNAAESFLPFIDIFILPSLWEAMSVVVLEAMGAGKPVVVSNVGENSHVIDNTIDGFVVEPKDIEQMDRILTLLINDPLSRKTIGENAKEKVRSQFGVERMVSAYQELYQSKG